MISTCSYIYHTLVFPIGGGGPSSSLHDDFCLLPSQDEGEVRVCLVTVGGWEDPVASRLLWWPPPLPLIMSSTSGGEVMSSWCRLLDLVSSVVWSSGSTFSVPGSWNRNGEHNMNYNGCIGSFRLTWLSWLIGFLIAGLKSSVILFCLQTSSLS